MLSGKNYAILSGDIQQEIKDMSLELSRVIYVKNNTWEL